MTVGRTAAYRDHRRLAQKSPARRNGLGTVTSDSDIWADGQQTRPNCPDKRVCRMPVRPWCSGEKGYAYRFSRLSTKCENSVASRLGSALSTVTNIASGWFQWGQSVLQHSHHGATHAYGGWPSIRLRSPVPPCTPLPAFPAETRWPPRVRGRPRRSARKSWQGSPPAPPSTTDWSRLTPLSGSCSC